MEMPIELIEPKGDLEKQIEMDKTQMKIAQDEYMGSVSVFREVFGTTPEHYKASLLEKSVVDKFRKVIDERRTRYEKIKDQVSHLQDQFYKANTR